MCTPNNLTIPIDPTSALAPRLVEHALVWRAFGGDVAAQRMLAARLHPTLLRVARRLLATRNAALDPSDLAQEAWLMLYARDWSALRAFDPTRSSLRHFVAVAGKRAMQGVLRRRGRSGSHELAMPSFDEDLAGLDEERRHVARDEAAKVLTALRARVPARTWTCFEQVALSGMPVPEVARQQGGSRASVDVRLFRARAEARALRRELDVRAA